jgi:hypothetical protein
MIKRNGDGKGETVKKVKSVRPGAGKLKKLENEVSK